MMRVDRFEIDADRFESFQGSQPVRSRRCDFQAWENRRYSRCSVLLADPSGTRVEHGAAPSFPASFINSIICRPLKIDDGPCGLAVRLNEQVIVADLTTETRWP